MKLVTFARQGESRLGALLAHDSQNFVMDFQRAHLDLPTDMVGFLRAGESAMAAALRAVNAPDKHALVDSSQVTLLAPVPRPGKLVCIGHNYRDHTGATPPEYPDIFAKFSNTVIGTHQSIVIPRASAMVDYEAELAVVIGKPARHVQPASALDVVAGYTIFNDVTARDYQKRQSQWTIGKTFDTFGPMGPALVTADEIGVPGDLELTLWVNADMRQHSNTRNLIFTIPLLIAYLSKVMTLEPGDVIATGTPRGTGASRKPPVFLKAGDEVRITIEKIGDLINPLVVESN